MTPSGKMAAPGESGDMGECRVHDVAAAMVGLPGGVVADVVGASAFLGGNWYVWQASVWVQTRIHILFGAYPPCLQHGA
jgi:hypothetical protein